MPLGFVMWWLILVLAMHKKLWANGCNADFYQTTSRSSLIKVYTVYIVTSVPILCVVMIKNVVF